VSRDNGSRNSTRIRKIWLGKKKDPGGKKCQNAESGKDALLMLRAVSPTCLGEANQDENSLNFQRPRGGGYEERREKGKTRKGWNLKK